MPAGPIEAALAAIARRPRTAFEIRSALGRKGHSPQAIDAALARLADLGYVDDARYAAAFVAGAASRKAWGPGRIRAELAKRGVAGNVADEAIRRSAEEEAQGLLPAIDRALEKALRRRGHPSDREGRDRIRAALARQGFSGSAIASAMKRLREDEATKRSDEE